MYRLGNEWLEGSTVERDLEVLADGKLNLNELCPGNQEGNCALGGIRHSITAGQERGLSHSALHWGSLT